MAKCKECKFYQEDPADVNFGFCKGNRVSGESAARNCPLKSFQRRIKDWLVAPYDNLFENLRKNAQNYFHNKIDDDLYTLHDVSHCINVEKMVKVLVSKAQIDFSALERFILSCASWTHDLGMNKDIAKEYFGNINIFGNQDNALRYRRNEHHNSSSWFVCNRYNILFGIENADELLLSAIRIVSTLIQYHRKTENILTCQEMTTVRGEVVRTRLLAAIFRLADTLHKDVSRFDPDVYAMIQLSGSHRASRLHWLKSYVVSNIHLDEYEQTISVQISLPDFHEFIELDDREDIRKTSHFIRNWNEHIRNLQYIISTDIEEDLVIVNQVFSTNGMPTYVKINTPVDYIRGYHKKYFSDIVGMLSELDILFSPNTSKVISQAITSLINHYEGTFEDEKKYHNLSSQILNYLRDVYEDRPCHVGLGKIIKLLHPYEKGKESDSKNLSIMLNKIDNHRKDAITKICNKADTIIGNNIKRIILIGYSSTAISILNQLSHLRNREKDNIEIIVLECSPKRRLGHSNVIEYNDGIHYANEIGKLDFYKVQIWPDIGLASLLCDEIEKDQEMAKSSLVLFGANGIDQTCGDCGHTSGHLSVAIIANHFKIPVIVVADSFKIGEITWNTSAERKGDWLLTQNKYIEELRNNYVEIKNYREDRIPVNLIWGIHTEDDYLEFKNIENESGLFEKAQISFRNIVKLKAQKYIDDLSNDLKAES